MIPLKKKKLSICSDCKNSSKPAINAAKLGHTNCLVIAYRELGVFNERDDFGATPIHFAARNGKLECLEWLVTRSGISPNAVTINSNTAAHDAAATGHLGCLKYLLENTKCSVADTTSEGANVLHVASRFGQTEVVKWLMKNAGCLSSDKGVNDVTPVHLCAAKNHINCLKWLTRHPSYVPNEKTSHGATAVYFAAQEGSYESLKWLIEEGKGHAYQTASDGMAPIHAASQAGNLSCLEYLVTEANISIRSRADDGATPAHFAAASGQVECLEWILDNGGSVQDRDNLGGTPVHDAAEQGQVGALSCMMQRGVDIGVTDNDGLKPVDLAKENNHTEAYQLLFRVTKSRLLTSLTPDHSLSRAVDLTEEQKAIIKAEKQQKFEEAMMTGLSVENREAMWHSAQQRASDFEPGLVTLLENRASALSAASTSDSAALDGDKDTVDRTPVSSVRKRKIPRNSADTTSLGTRPSLDVKLFQDDSSPAVEDKEIIKKIQNVEASQTVKEISSSKPVSPSSSKVKREETRKSTSTGQDGFLFKFFTGKSGSKAKKLIKRKHSSNEPDSGIEASKKQVRASQSTSPIKQSISPGSKATTTISVTPTKPSSPSKKSTPQSPDRKKLRLRLSLSPKPTKAQVSPDKKGKKPLSRSATPLKAKNTIPQSPNTEKKSEWPVSEYVLKVKQPLFAEGNGKGLVSTGEKTKAKRPVSSEGFKNRRPVSASGAKPRRPASIGGTAQPTSTGGLKPKKPVSAGGSEQKHPKKKIKRKAGRKPAKKLSAKQEKMPLQQRKGIKQKEMISIKSDEMIDSLASNLVQDSLVTLLEDITPQTQNETTEKRDHVQVMAQNLVQDIMKKAIDDASKETTHISPSTPLTESSPTAVPPSQPPQFSSPLSIEDIKKADKPDKADKPKTSEVQREKKEKKSKMVKEKAIITKSPERKSVVTPDEAFTVKFVTETPNVKESFPVTHSDLMTDGDLSSPGSSDDEGQFRESFTAPGYDRLNEKNFDDFGKDVKELESQLEKKEKEWAQERQSLAESNKSRHSVDMADQIKDELKVTAISVKQETKNISPSLEKSINQILEGPPEILTHQEEVKTNTDVVESKQNSQEVEKEASSIVNSEIHQFEKHTVDREYTDVLKIADKFQAKSSGTTVTASTTTTRKAEENKSSKLSDRLNMFGGGASFIKSPPIIKPKEKEEDKETKEELVEVIGDVLKTEPIPLPESKLANHHQKSNAGSSSRRRSSGCVSVTTFETITEEGVDESHESMENLDKVTPLPKIEPSLSRRQSAELLRLDGIMPLSDTKLDSFNDTFPENGYMRTRRSSDGETHHSSSIGKALSPLVHKFPSATNKAQDKPNSKVRSISVSIPATQGLETMALYMNSANLPHLTSLQDEHEEMQKKRVAESVDGLLSQPRWGEASAQLKFIGLKTDDKVKVQVWRQRAMLFTHLHALSEVDFAPKDMYVFLQVKPHGPLLYHIYLWVGVKVRDTAIEEGYICAQNLAHCLPGKPVIHKEFYGYETNEFRLMLGNEAKRLTGYHMLVPSNLTETTLVEYHHSTSSFGIIDCSKVSYYYINNSKNPILMNSPTCLYMWLPDNYWSDQLEGKQQIALMISEAFIRQASLPKWTPVIIMTQNAEELSFCSCFPDWEWTDLTQSPKNARLRLLILRAPSLTYPATGQLKAWQLKNNDLENTPAYKMGHFYSNSVHVVQYIYQKQSSLYVWMEGMVYVWIGSEVKGTKEAMVREVLEKYASAGSVPNLPIVIVPEGKEPTQLLYLFRGKFIIQKYPQLQASRLYKLSGIGALGIKSTEVPPQASSLHSSHSFFLLVEGSMSYVWSGQFSDKNLRRGALVISKILTNSKEVHKVAEGLEPPDFWMNIGGSKKHEHFSSISSLPYAVPKLYSININQDWNSFTQLPSTKKDEVVSNICYLLVYNDQFFIRLGKDLKKVDTGIKIVQDYILQYCGFKTENDFVTTVVHEGHEGEMFWKWFNTQDFTTLHGTSSGELQNLNIEDIEDVDFNNELEQNSSTGLSKLNNESSSAEPNQVTEEPSKLQSLIPSQADTSKSIAVKEMIQQLEDLTEDSKVTESVEDKAKNETAEILSDMISDLEGILNPHSSSDKNESKLEISLDESQTNLKMQDNLSLSTEMTMDAQGKQEAKHLLKVTVQEISKEVEVLVKETALVRTVLFKAAEVAGIKLKDNTALFEISESLKLQRSLEDHELIKDIVKFWPSKNRPKLLLRTFPTKNILWTAKTPIPKQEILAYTSSGEIPNIVERLHHCRKGGPKMKWGRESFVLQEMGIYSASKDMEKRMLSCSLDHVLYVPLTVKGKKMDTVTPFCFIMKHPTSWKEKDMKLYCAPDDKSFLQWIHGIRLLKHGIQLKGNFIAMKKRLEKLLEKELLKEATGVTSPL